MDRFQQAFLDSSGTGKGFPLVAEKLVCQQLLAKGPAVDGEESSNRAIAQLMDGLGHQFLAGAGFSEDEYVAVRRGDLFDRLPERIHLGTVPDQ